MDNTVSMSKLDQMHEMHCKECGKPHGEDLLDVCSDCEEKHHD